MNFALFATQKFRLFTGLLAILLILGFVIWQNSTKVKSAVSPKTKETFENYDIRLDKNPATKTAIKKFTERSGRENKTTGLPEQPPHLKIEYNKNLQIPEVISPKTSNGKNFLTSPTRQKRAEILRQFLNQNSGVFGLDETQISHLKITTDHTNPDGNLSFVQFGQEINGIPVFGGEIKAGFTKQNEIIRVINNLAPHLNYKNVTTEFKNAGQAVLSSAKHIGIEANENDVKRIEANENDEKITFERGQFARQTTAEKIYFPVADGVVRPAWRVLLWQKPEAFYVIVDAETGLMLWRKNITEYQTQTATFNVYGNLTGQIKTADSPSPFSPGCTDPNNCPQPPIIARTDFTLIGNEPPFNFNDLGWIPDGENRTIGNNAEAGIDRDGTQGIDPNGWAFGNPNRVFKFIYNPAPGNPAPGEEPIPTTQTYPPSQFQQGSITNAFYTINRWHDETYLLGFTESAFNFQTENFDRGGMGNDSISVEVQDSSGTNGANFSTPADGGRPIAQFFVWTASTPGRDAALDNQMIVHEVTHGLSNRLHGNASGLSSNMARGMGEGWSDFFALALLAEPTDDIAGTYPFAGYITQDLLPFESNHYYGIRRFPYAIFSSVGTNGLPHNPLTFADIDQTQVDYSDGAYPALIAAHLSNTADQVHNLGTFWATALWEVRAVLIGQHGAIEGNRRAMQYVLDGMKLSPLDPHLIQSRDAIIAAANASAPADVNLVREGFRIRGMGFSANIINAGSGGGTARVMEAFDSPNVFVGEGFLVSDAPGNNNGFPESGEPLLLTIPLINNTGNTITGVTLRVVGGGSAFYGDIQDGQTISRNINFTVPCNANCGGVYSLTFNINGSAGTKTETRDIFLGVPFGDPPVTFENPTPIEVPFKGSNSGSGPANPSPSTINVSGLSGNKSIKIELTDVNHSWADDIDILLEGPGGQKMIIMSDAFGNTDPVATTITISDGGEAGLMPDNGPLVTGDYQPTNFGAMDDFDAPAPVPPYESPAPGGTATLASEFGTDGSTMNGDWKLWIDDDSGGEIGTIGGWKITFESAEYICSISSCLVNARADFDGDGRTDISVFRPSEGNWYLNQSTSGFSVVNWGISTDRQVPSDYDGDGKTDVAIFRANSDSNFPDFYILNSNSSTFSGFSWGLPDDIPTIEDYDGDGRADIAIFRPSTHTFYVLKSGDASLLTFANIQFGTPVTGDFDGDGRGDFATYSTNGWFLAPSNIEYGAVNFVQWGAFGDNPVAADYDGDGKDDFAVFRPSDQIWYIRQSLGGNVIRQFGISTDIPVPGDYDGDGKADIAVFRDGIWYIDQSTSGLSISQFGLNGDKPIPNSYLPQ